jgi:SAM-dependent methyltransferase
LVSGWTDPGARAYDRPLQRDLYQHPPRDSGRRPGAVSRRALLGLRPARAAPSEDDYRAVGDAVRVAWERPGHEPLLRQLEPVAEIVAGLADAGPGARVLDVGAADGNVALACERRGAEVAACDQALAMVDRGRSRCGPRVEWAVAGVESLPHADATFDAVLSSFGATLASRPDVAVRELVRAARPGGTVILTAWIPRGLPGQLEELAERLEPLPTGVPSPTRWGAQAVARERLRPQLDGLELRTRTVRLRFGDPGSAFDALARTLALDPSRHAELRGEFDALLRSTNNAVTGVEIPARYLLARGRRPASS